MPGYILSLMVNEMSELELSVDSLCCELCGEPTAGEDGVPLTLDGAGGIVMACPVCVAARDAARMFDLADLTGDHAPCSIADFLDCNQECPPDASEVSDLRSCELGGTVNLGIGGGFVMAIRVA